MPLLLEWQGPAFRLAPGAPTASVPSQQVPQHGRQPVKHPLPCLVFWVDAVWGRGSPGNAIQPASVCAATATPSRVVKKRSRGSHPHISTRAGPSRDNNVTTRLGRGLAGDRHQRCSSAVAGRLRRPPRRAVPHSPPGPLCAAAAQRRGHAEEQACSAAANSRPSRVHFRSWQPGQGCTDTQHNAMAAVLGRQNTTEPLACSSIQNRPNSTMWAAGWWPRR